MQAAKVEGIGDLSRTFVEVTNQLLALDPSDKHYEKALKKVRCYRALAVAWSGYHKVVDQEKRLRKLEERLEGLKPG